MGKQTDLIEGNISKALLVFAVPLLIGNLFQQLYNTADSYVVGNFVDTNALAAVGASASVIQMLVGFFMGLSVGAGVVIAQYFGAGQKEKMSQAVHSALALTVLLSVLFTVAGIALTRPLLRAIGVPQEVLPHSTLYLTIYFAGITFLLFYNMGSGILRAIGNSRDPLIYLAVASVLNVILDVLLVCVARLGVAGVALGTMIAQAVSAYLVMRQLIRTSEAYRVELKKIRFHREMMADVRKRIIFRGRVQGVGFRYTAKYLAQSLGLTGWVRNEYDGTVLLEIQGSEYMINKLLMGLNHNQFITIEWMDTEELPLDKEEKSFSVR